MNSELFVVGGCCSYFSILHFLVPTSNHRELGGPGMEEPDPSRIWNFGEYLVPTNTFIRDSDLTNT
jgi:hypothetical protein